jgi:hypothetical protein
MSDFQAIDWREEFDDLDNSYWEGLSIFSTDSDPEAGPNLHWRIRQRLENNMIEFFEDSDSDLMGMGLPDFWTSLEEAKTAIQEKHNESIVDHFSDINPNQVW